MEDNSVLLVTRLSAWPATACFLVAWAFPYGKGSSVPVVFRRAWISGAVALAVHVAIAFVLFHAGSHGSAYQHTLERTRAMTGWESGAGLYLNYLMLGLWVADAAWLILGPVSYARRPIWMDRLVVYYFAFMLVNAAIVFAPFSSRILWGLLFVAATIERVKRIHARNLAISS